MIKTMPAIVAALLLAVCVGSGAQGMTAQEHNEAGVLATNNGDPRTALGHFRQASIQAPDNQAIFRNLITAYMNAASFSESQGDYAAALDYAEAAWQRAPADTRTSHCLALIKHNQAVQLSEQGSPQRADQLLAEAMNLAEAANLQELQGKFASTQAQNLALWARELSAEGDSQRSQIMLQRALELDPNCGQAHLEMGRSAYDSREYGVALQHLETAQQLLPEIPNLGAFTDRVQREAEVESDFMGLGAGSFKVYFQGREDAALSGEVLRILKRAEGSLGQKLKAYPKRTIQVTLYSDDQFATVTGAPEWTQGAYDGKIRVRTQTITLGGSPALEDVLYHEYAHALVTQICEEPLPAWLNEGLAQFFEPNDPVSDGERLRLAQLADSDSLPSFSRLPQPTFIDINDSEVAQIVYIQSKVFIDWLARKYGGYRLRQVLELLNEGMSITEAFSDVYPFSLDQLQQRWMSSLPG